MDVVAAREVLRVRNIRIASAARDHHFDGRSPVPFLCECGVGGCREHVPLTLLDYDRAREHARYVVAAGHDGADADVPPAAAGF